jgi:cohesin loading factor subunit SCC2
MQKSLIGYLDSLLGNDAALQFSKYFLVAQWLKELCNPATKTSTSESSDNTIEIHSALYNQRKRVYELIERTSTIKNQQQQQTATTTTMSLQLDINEALTLTKYLCSLKKTLDKNFDFYLITILNLSGAGLETNTPTQVRSKAIKCLSLIIEVDPQILLKPKVYACVEANFLHPTISVREASVDLIGKFISHKPELTNHYYKLLSDRILDVGVSVRKRVIKIFRDICLNQPEFEALSEVCVKILRRIVDEDNIKKLVIETFYR